MKRARDAGMTREIKMGRGGREADRREERVRARQETDKVNSRECEERDQADRLVCPLFLRGEME